MAVFCREEKCSKLSSPKVSISMQQPLSIASRTRARQYLDLVVRAIGPHDQRALVEEIDALVELQEYDELRGTCAASLQTRCAHCGKLIPCHEKVGLFCLGVFFGCPPSIEGEVLSFSSRRSHSLLSCPVATEQSWRARSRMY